MFIVTKKIDSENIGKVCRTCLREDSDKMVYLFIGPAESSLGAKLQSLSCLKISQGDGLPEKMCNKCVVRAESALLFREQCQAADRALKQALVTTTSIYNNYTYASSYSTSELAHIQQNQSFVLSSQNSPFTSSAAVAGASTVTATATSLSSSFSSLSHNESMTGCQPLYVQNQFSYPVFDQKEKSLPQQSHIIKSCGTDNINVGHSNFDSCQTYVNKASFIKTDNLDASTLDGNNVHYKKNCTLQCTLCSHPFFNKTQSINYVMADNEKNYTDLSDNNVEIYVENNPFVTMKKKQETIASHLIEHSSNTVFHDKNDLNCTKKTSKCLNFLHGVNKNNFKDIRTTSLLPVDQKNIISKTLENENFLEMNKNSIFQCETCFLFFNKKSKLIAHQLTHDDKKSFQCIYCNKSYTLKNKLAAHIRLHTQTNVHRCDVCEKTFAYPSYLRDHMKTHWTKQIRQQAIFKCTQCNKQFHLAKSYKRHMKFHTGKDLYYCDKCDKVFSNVYSLKIHMRSHQKNKFYKCDICDKAFNQKSNLVEHTRTHTKDKPFKCKICEKSFVQSSHLRNHQVSHNSIRSFQCRTCGKRFKLSSHLKRHVNSHTTSKIHKCDHCSQIFSQAFSLKRHLKKKHKQLINENSQDC